jgi:hypothetical protein
MAWGKVDYRKVERVELDGRSFRSKAESQLYLYLKALEQSGEIRELECEQKVTLLPGARNERIEYYADFVCFDLKLNEKVWVECKGFETDKWKMKLKLWRHFGPGLLRIYKVGWNRLDLFEEVYPKSHYEAQLAIPKQAKTKKVREAKK